MVQTEGYPLNSAILPERWCHPNHKTRCPYWLTHSICVCEQSFQFQAKGCNLTPKETRQVTAMSQAVR